MDAAKVEVTLGGDVGNVCRDLPLFAELPYGCRSRGIVDGDQDHVGPVKICWLEDSIDMRDLPLGYSVRNLIVEARRGTDNVHVGIGVQAVEDASRSNLCAAQSLSVTEYEEREGGSRASHLTTADHQDPLVLDLPCQYQAPARLDLWELFAHGGACCDGCTHVPKSESQSKM